MSYLSVDNSKGTENFVVKTGATTQTISGNLTISNGVFSTTGATISELVIGTGGSDTLPKLRISGDANTGIYSPAADQLRVSCGGGRVQTWEANGVRLHGSTAGNNALYSPSLLGYYEEATISDDFLYYDLANTMNFKITRIGRIVNLTATNTVSYGVPDVNVDIIESSTGFIPVRFRPASTLYTNAVWILENGSTLKFWNIRVGSDGVLWFQRDTSTFASLNTYLFSCTWCI